MSHRIEDWNDATRLIGRAAMRGALNDALHRLREAIEPPPRITQRSLLSPYVLTDDDELYTQFEQSLDEVGEVRPPEPVVP